MSNERQPLILQAPDKPGLLDKIWIAALFCSVPAMALWWVPKYFIVHNEQKLTVYLFTQMRKYISRNVSLAQMRVLKPVNTLEHDLNTKAFKSGSELYPNYNKQFLANGANSQWLTEIDGRTPDDPVVLYLHGGAYCMTTYPLQVEWCLKVSKRFKRLSVLEVDYTVSPVGRYPTQLKEALAVYVELQKSCKRIIVLGDSAGGHLAVTLQKRLDEQHIAKPLGVVLVSPWVELWPRSTGSYKDNLDRDYLNISERLPLRFCSREEIESPYANPMRGDASFWHNVFGPNTINVWGEHETLKDTCREFGQVAGITDFFEEPLGLHDIMAFGVVNASTDFIVQRVAGWLGQEPNPTADSSKFSKPN